MSRARPIRLPNGEERWFDTERNHELASDRHLELLAAVEDIDIDELLDSVLTQGEVLLRLRKALGQGPIPIDVLERRRRAKERRQLQPECRSCGAEGNSTRHHFVNKWILRELSDYSSKWAERQQNCINLCTTCHKRLHYREDDNKSIVPLLTPEEKEFAENALHALSEERPKLLLLIARGDSSVYETQLVRDWIAGEFASKPIPYARHERKS